MSKKSIKFLDYVIKKVDNISLLTVEEKEKLYNDFYNEKKKQKEKITFPFIYKEIKSIGRLKKTELCEDISKLGEEYGEYVSELNKIAGIKNTKDDKDTIRENIILELADLLQNSLYIASKLNIKYEEIYDGILIKNKAWAKLMKQK